MIASLSRLIKCKLSMYLIICRQVGDSSVIGDRKLLIYFYQNAFSTFIVYCVTQLMIIQYYVKLSIPWDKYFSA